MSEPEYDEDLWHACRELTKKQRYKLGVFNRNEISEQLVKRGYKVSTRTVDRKKSNWPTVMPPKGYSARPRYYYILHDVLECLDGTVCEVEAYLEARGIALLNDEPPTKHERPTLKRKNAK